MVYVHSAYVRPAPRRSPLLFRRYIIVSEHCRAAPPSRDRYFNLFTVFSTSVSPSLRRSIVPCRPYDPAGGRQRHGSIYRTSSLGRQRVVYDTHSSPRGSSPTRPRAVAPRGRTRPAVLSAFVAHRKAFAGILYRIYAAYCEVDPSSFFSFLHASGPFPKRYDDNT